MNIIKNDPFRELRNLQDEMTRLFAGATPSNREEFMSGGWAPNVDIYENQDQLVLEADLPGMNREDLELSIENNIITIKGERRFEKKAEGDSYHRVERSYGSFTRSFTLPQTVSAENVKAEFRNGVLSVTLPKREEVKARKIEVLGDDNQSQPKTIDAKSKPASA